MRRSVLAFTWVLGTTMSVVLAWWGVSVVGEQVATRRDAPFAEEAIDIPPSTSAPITPAAPPPTVQAELDAGSVAAITGFLNASGSTVPAETVAPAVVPTAPAGRPRSTTVPPTTAAPVDDTTTTATTSAPPSTTEVATTTSPPTVPPGTTTPTTAARPTTTTRPASPTTTAPASTTSTAAFPPGWDDRGAFEPKDRGTSTYTFDCGSVTLHWRNYRVIEITADLREDLEGCIDNYDGAQLDIRQIPSTGETEFVVTYPDGSVDRWVMPPPAHWQPPVTTTTSTPSTTSTTTTTTTTATVPEDDPAV